MAVYNVASPLDAIAARWASEQEPSGLFPIGNVDLGVADFEIAVRSRVDKAPAQAVETQLEGATLAPIANAEIVDSMTAANDAEDDDDGLVVLLRSGKSG